MYVYMCVSICLCVCVCVCVCVFQLEEGEALAQSVVIMAEEAGESLPRAHLAVGLCCSLRASDGKRSPVDTRDHQWTQEITSVCVCLCVLIHVDLKEIR